MGIPRDRGTSRKLRAFLVATILSVSLQAANAPVPETIVLRGRAQRLYFIPASVQQSESHPPLLFIPGDGGWRGSAVNIGRMVAALGYDVYGFDVRRYLTGFTTSRSALTDEQMASDMERVAESIAFWNRQPVILLGWSQGAAMVVLTAARARHKEAIHGVLTVALPESGFLGWRRRDSLLALFRRDAHEPEFQVSPLLPDVAPVPLWMIYGTRDRFTASSVARRLASLARRPRRRSEIDGGNHGLSGHRDQLLASLRTGLTWIEGRGAAVRSRLAAGNL
jgi:pimeloyl-ACP methyl ester carboxylesterase